MEDPNNVDAAIQLAFLCPTFKDSIEILEVSEKKGIAILVCLTLEDFVLQSSSILVISCLYLAKVILKRILGQTVFEDDRVGKFWDIIATRPYMRVLQAQVRFYFEDKQYNSAAYVPTLFCAR